jgi:hypothetical protein
MTKASNALFAAIGLMSLTTSGCVMNRPASPPEVLDSTPIAVDAAMERRNWEQSRAVYASTGTVAGNTGLMFRSDPARPDWQNGIAEPFIFLTNVGLMPVSLVMTPPFAPVEYRSATVEPTYSGNPPLPEAPAPSEATPPLDAPPADAPQPEPQPEVQPSANPPAPAGG